MLREKREFAGSTWEFQRKTRDENVDSFEDPGKGCCVVCSVSAVAVWLTMTKNAIFSDLWIFVVWAQSFRGRRDFSCSVGYDQMRIFSAFGFFDF